MNLHAIASSAISGINPMRPVQLYASAGSIDSPDGLRKPQYAAPVKIMGQIQSLSYSDIQHVESLNIQGVRSAVYLSGNIDGIVRSKRKGGDLLAFDGAVYLVAVVLEDWPEWTKVAVTLQDDVVLPDLAILPPQPTIGALPVHQPIGGGKIRYAEAAGSPPVSVAQNARTLLTFAIDPAQTQDFLNPPFKGNLSFDGTAVTPRALDDSFLIVVNLLVTSSISGGSIRFDVDVGSPLGPIASDTEELTYDAGVPERVQGKLYIQTLAYAMQNGVKIYLKPTVPISIVNEAIIIEVLSTYGVT